MIDSADGNTSDPYEIIKVLRDRTIEELLRNYSVMAEAAAGARKTRLLVDILDRFASGTRAESVLAVAFNVAAANEIAMRSSLGPETRPARTIQGVLEDAFRHERPGWHRMSPAEREDCINAALGRFPPASRCDRFLRKRLLDQLTGERRCAPAQGSPEVDVLLEMARLRKARCLYDTCDVLAFVSANPYLIVEYLESHLGIGLLLVDEAQDLSEVEWRVVQAWHDKGHPCLVVGDPHQCINGFRHADPKGMDRFAEQPRVVKLSLPVTFRCKSAITERLSPLHEKLFLGGGPIVSADKGGIGVVSFVHHGERLQAEREVLMATAIEVGATMGKPLSPQKYRPPGNYPASEIDRFGRAGLSDLAVLVSTNEEAEKTESFLRGCGFPVLRLKARPPDPRAGVAARVLLSALDPFGKTAPFKIQDASAGLRILLGELARRPGTRLSGVGELEVLMQKLAEASSGGESLVHKVALSWCSDPRWPHRGQEIANYMRAAKLMLQVVLDPSETSEATKRLIQTVCNAYGFYYMATTTPYAAVRYLLEAGEGRVKSALSLRKWPVPARADGLSPLKPGEKRVVVATINQAKGLSFEGVWLIGLSGKVLPYRGQDDEEERCRFWVAATRATELLVVHLQSANRTYIDLLGPCFEVGADPPLVHPRSISGYPGSRIGHR